MNFLIMMPSYITTRSLKGTAQNDC
jgi:hypothetical protein